MQRATHHPTPPLFPYPVHAKGTPGGGSAPESSEESGHSPDPDQGEGGRALFCKVCRSKITRRELAMRIDGKHRHVFFNPHGLVFEIGCFASAKNIIPGGPKTDEFTWFPGYAWQAVGCSGCSSMLGWRYFGKNGGFYGLILSALIEGEDLGR
ncbi:cereblon family protein [uncultured Pseudodesulfovibrio sp.]|uniref:cereblon family protein n=1 Tax=uncultured Pseudodesulfovibrio sp. TaxID=2035858 RepID=UPI0029C90E90|nr:cereblon family protein [uncultured Pseudodesulfovibrio sp.]